MSRGPTGGSPILGVRVVFLLSWFMLACLFFFFLAFRFYVYLFIERAILLFSIANPFNNIFALGS